MLSVSLYKLYRRQQLLVIYYFPRKLTSVLLILCVNSIWQQWSTKYHHFVFKPFLLPWNSLIVIIKVNPVTCTKNVFTAISDRLNYIRIISRASSSKSECFKGCAELYLRLSLDCIAYNAPKRMVQSWLCDTSATGIYDMHNKPMSRIYLLHFLFSCNCTSNCVQ